MVCPPEISYDLLDKNLCRRYYACVYLEEIKNGPYDNHATA